MPAATLAAADVVEAFACYGGSCAVLVSGRGAAGTAEEAVRRARRRMLEWHAQFSRFDPRSELSGLNADRRECVGVSPMMLRFVMAALDAASLTGGLVDPTLIGELEDAGYAADLGELPEPLPAPVSGSARQALRPAAPHRAARWRTIGVDRDRMTVTRPPSVRLDSGGIAKGLFGDVLASILCSHERFAIVAAGDVRVGGAARSPRAVEVTSPFAGGGVLHAFELAEGAAATSGITRRRWSAADGGIAHHLLDPATGRPAFTGIVQATALAPPGVEAEARAKAALLAGPVRAPGWLVHGGVLVGDDGRHDVIEPTEDLA